MPPSLMHFMCAVGNLCKREYRPQLVVSVLTMIFQQFDGINAIIVRSPVHAFPHPSDLTYILAISLILPCSGTRGLMCAVCSSMRQCSLHRLPAALWEVS